MGAERTTAGQPPDLRSLCLALTEHAPLPMATVEGATHLVRYVNPAFCRLMDKPAAQLVGKPLSELLPEKDECVTLLDRVFRTGEPQSHTEQESSKPHPVFWSYTIWPVLADEGLVGIMIQVTESAPVHGKTVAMNEALMLGSVRQHELTEAAENLNARLRVEIAERKQAEEALHRAQAELADRAVQLEHMVAERTAELTSTNTQLETFVYSIAHDLRAPLRAMEGFSTLLMEEGAALTEKGRDFADRINRSALRMDALLIDLLNFSRIAQQRIELTSVNLENAIRSALSSLEKEIQQKHARVEAVAPWPVVLAHGATLGQVLFNLMSNALKFVAPGVPPLVRVRAEERAEFIRIWVEDNGIGIEPEYQDQVFRLFTQLRPQKYSGTGVGLAIAQKGVVRMGGRVGVESMPGRGSRFWFELRKP
jgi:signal transduction histidine kinase